MNFRQIGWEAFVTGFSGAMMPGSLLVATIVLVGARGFWAGPQMIIGHGLLEIVLVIAIMAGLHRFLDRPEAPLVRIIGVAGGLMLLWMGADMLRSVPHLSLTAVATDDLRYSPIPAGIVYSAVNPYFWIWWASIGLGLLGQAAAHRGRVGVGVFFAGHITSDLTWYSLIAGLLASGGRLLGDGPYRLLIALCAIFLLWLGVRFIRLGWRPPVPAAVEADPPPRTP